MQVQEQVCPSFYPLSYNGYVDLLEWGTKLAILFYLRNEIWVQDNNALPIIENQGNPDIFYYAGLLGETAS